MNPLRQPIAVWVQEEGSFQLDRTLTPGPGGNHRGMVITDLDGDGWLDLVARDLAGGAARIHMATCGAGNALSLRLRQDASNRDAIGARVWLQLPDGRVLLREVLSGSEGLASGGPPVLHIGLGDAEGGTLRVRWPDGAWSDLGSVSAGRSLLVRRTE